MLAVRGGLFVAVAASAALVPASFALQQVPHLVTTRITVTGEITKLAPARISIGRLGCAIPASLEANAGRFVISDPVKMSCVNGNLRSVKYAPELATAQSSRAGYGNAPTTVPTPPTPTGTARVEVYSFSVIFLGGPPAGDSTTVAGTIDDLSPTTVTVAGMTCSFRPLSTSPYSGGAMIGDNVTLTCTGGQLIRLASVGSVTRS
jgi:hypothetical protein